MKVKKILMEEGLCIIIFGIFEFFEEFLSNFMILVYWFNKNIIFLVDIN